MKAFSGQSIILTAIKRIIFEPMLVESWPTVCDAGSTFTQHKSEHSLHWMIGSSLTSLRMITRHFAII